MTELRPLHVAVPDAMRLLGIGRTKLYSLIGERKLEQVHIGAKALVTVDSIERFADSLREREAA